MSGRPLVATFGLLALVGVAVMGWMRLRIEPQRGPVEPPRSQGAESPATLAEVDEPLREDDSARAASEKAPVGPDGRPADLRVQSTRMSGRVVDRTGTPLANVLVESNWKGLDGVRTAADGTFALAAEFPPQARFTLHVWGRPYHSCVDLWFARLPNKWERRLPVGDVDLGDIVLDGCGAVRGRVLDAGRRPLEHVVVKVLSRTDGLVPTVESAADGRFELGGLPLGDHAIGLKLPGFLPAPKLVAPVRVGETFDFEDVVLEDAPTIAGTVVDDTGAAAPGVKVGVYAVGGAFSQSFALSDETGAFTIPLTGRGDFAIEVRGDERYEPYGTDRQPGAPAFAPGTRGIRVVLQRAKRFTFRVVEAATGAPLERFGLRVEREPRLHAPYTDTGEVTDHPGGTVVAAASPGTSRVTVWAPGRGSVDRIVAPDAGTADVVTLALGAGAVVRGRVTRSGGPVVFAEAWLTTEVYDGESRLAPRPGEEIHGRPLGPQDPRVLRRELRTDEHGEFEVRDVPAGTYAFVVHTTWTTDTYVRAIELAAGQSRDLGDVELAAGVTLYGRLLAPPGESPVRYLVIAQRPWRDDGAKRVEVRVLRIETQDGRFAFEHLDPGDWLIGWARPETPEDRATDFVRDSRLMRDLRDRDRRELLLDATMSGPCRIEVRVLREGAPLPGALVTATDVSIAGNVPQPRKTVERERNLGRTDAGGRLTMTLEGGLRFKLSACVEKGAPIAVSDEFETTAGGRVECELRVRTGTLCLDLPATPPPPTEGMLIVHLKRSGREWPTRFLQTPQVKAPSLAAPSWTPGVARLGEYLVGDYEVEIDFLDLAPASGGSGKVTTRASFRSQVSVRADEEVHVSVR